VSAESSGYAPHVVGLTPGITGRARNVITVKFSMRAALSRGRVHAVVVLQSTRWHAPSRARLLECQDSKWC
jgi:hypothetical protein